MKKHFIAFSLSLFLVSAFAQNSTDSRTLFTTGSDKVSVSDFQYVYNKNNVNNQADYSEKSLREFIEFV